MLYCFNKFKKIQVKKKKVTRTDKNGEEIIINKSLLAQDFWKLHFQILSIISLKELIELNVNLDAMIKNVKHADLNISIATIFLKMQTLNMI